MSLPRRPDIRNKSAGYTWNDASSLSFVERRTHPQVDSFEWRFPERYLELVHKQLAGLLADLADNVAASCAGAATGTANNIIKLRILRPVELRATARACNTSRDCRGGHGVFPMNGHSGSLPGYTTMTSSHSFRSQLPP